MANIITRRSFMKAGAQAAVGLGLASLMNIPPFLKRALAEGNIGINGKKLLFLFMRGGNDGINNLIPVLDPSYYNYRAVIGIPKHPQGDTLYQGTGGPGSVVFDPANPGAAISLNNGFAGLNPAMSDLVPLYNTGRLALIHRAGYRSLSRSHFDSEKFYEKGADGVTASNRLINDGLWYRTIVESGWNRNHALSGVSIQSNLPQSLRGAEPMTNLSSIGRYNVLGVYNASGSTNTDRVKMLNAIDAANQQPYPAKDNRDLVYNLGVQFRDTLDVFQDPAFSSNEFYDADGTTHLFPVNSASDQRGLGSGAYGFMQNIKSCAQLLASTDTVITGTEIGGFDTHTAQVVAGAQSTGGHANLLRRIAWTYYALAKFFSTPAYNNRGPNGTSKANFWNDVVLVTMSEFGRTSAENGSMGTDHGEASVMYIAGGGINGGVYGCDMNNNAKLGGLNWQPGTTGKTGALFSADTNVGYLRRTIDYRSVLGEIIRDHLGATQNQLNRIIPAYGLESAEHLKDGGTVGSTPIIGELGLI